MAHLSSRLGEGPLFTEKRIWTPGLRLVSAVQHRRARNMQRPPDKQTAPGVNRGGGGSGSAELKSKQQSDSELSFAVQAINDATERAEYLLALWREQRRLAHRVRLARLRFELIGLDPDEQEDLANEVAEWGQLVKAFARAGMHLDDINEDRGERLGA